jgi:hypothetical protein
VVLWRKKTAFELKAAGLATAIPLASFYFEAYDLALLSVALAYLYRHRPFDTRDWFAAACAMLSFAAFWWERSHPATLIACTAVGAIVCMRLWRTHPAAAVGAPIVGTTRAPCGLQLSHPLWGTGRSFELTYHSLSFPRHRPAQNAAGA